MPAATPRRSRVVEVRLTNLSFDAAAQHNRVGTPAPSSRNSALSSLETRLSAYRPHLLAVLRIVTALLFLSHGMSKMFGFPDAGTSAPLLSLLGLAAILEIVGGILLVIGLFTRPVAFVLAGEMAVAYFMAHAPRGFFPLVNHGESAVLFCFIFLYLVMAGPGSWSVDKRIAA
jgi:putative oxidoreductase